MKKWMIIGIALVLLTGCDKFEFSLKPKGDQKQAPAVEEPPARPSLKNKTDPAWNSYGIGLPLVMIRKESTDESEVAGDPFVNLKPATGNRAFMSANRYEVEATNLLTVRPLDESNYTGESLPDPNQLAAGEPTALFKAPLTITAGPIACTNALILADSEPAILILDPERLELIKRFPVDGLILAFTAFNPDTAELSVLFGDQSTATYRFVNEEPPVIDPVAQLIGPSDGALQNMADRTKKLLSSTETIQFDRTRIFPISSEIALDKPTLFRLAVDADGMYRLYLDGIGDTPFIMILFNETGDSIFSNVEYAAEKVMEQNLEKGNVYYLVVSLFPGNQANDAIQNRIPQLMVKRK